MENMPPVPDVAASTTAVKTVARGIVVVRIAAESLLLYDLNTNIRLDYAVCQHLHFIQHYLALQDTVALAAAGCGPLLMWRTPLFFQGVSSPLPQLDDASAALTPHLDRCLLFVFVFRFVWTPPSFSPLFPPPPI